MVEKTYILHQTFCLDTCASIRIHVHTFANSCIHLHTFIYVHLHVSTHIYIHVHTSKYMFMHLHTCSYLYIHHTSTMDRHTVTCIYIHLHACEYNYVHAFAYIYHVHLHISASSFTFVYTHVIHLHLFPSICIHLHTFNHLHNTSIYTHVHPFTSFCISLQISSPPDLSRVLHVYFSIFYTLKSECKTSGRWITNWIIVDKYFWFKNDQQLDDYSCVFPIAGFQDQQEITIPHLLPSAEVWFYGQCRVFSFGTHGPGGSAGHGVCCMLLGFVFLSET